MDRHVLYQPVHGLEMVRRIEADLGERERVVVDALARIDEVESQIGAMTAVVHREEALARATFARGPLAGVPVAVKDIFDTSDLVTSYGSPIYEGYRPRSDAAIVTLLRRSGAVIIGKSATTEFAFKAPVGTRNPCDTSRTTGGSSSGSAAAVAAGIVPYAIGSQTGGSTIRPASFCGIAGFKPSFGMLPPIGMKCFSWSCDTVGLFAAGVADVAYLAQVLSGRPLAVSDGMSAPVFGVPECYPWTKPSANATAVLDVAINAIERAGGRVRRIRFGSWMEDLISAYDTIQRYEAWQALGYEYDHHRSELSPELSTFLDHAGASANTEDYLKALALLENARHGLAALFGGVTALLTPSAPDEAPEGFASMGDSAFSRNWTLLGCPCVNVPGLWGMRSGPVGVQVIGRRGEDVDCLSAAAFVEAAISESRGG